MWLYSFPESGFTAVCLIRNIVKPLPRETNGISYLLLERLAPRVQVGFVLNENEFNRALLVCDRILFLSHLPWSSSLRTHLCSSEHAWMSSAYWCICSVGYLSPAIRSHLLEVVIDIILSCSALLRFHLTIKLKVTLKLSKKKTCFYHVAGAVIIILKPQIIREEFSFILITFQRETVRPQLHRLETSVPSDVVTGQTWIIICWHQTNYRK